MKKYRFILLFASLIIFNFLFVNSSANAAVLTRQIKDYHAIETVTNVNNDVILGSQEIWQWTGDPVDNIARKSDDRTAGLVTPPKKWKYFGGNPTETKLPDTIEYSDADGYSGTLNRDILTGPYYGWDRYRVMGYIMYTPDQPKQTYEFYKVAEATYGKAKNLYYNACTQQDIGVYAGTIYKTVGKPVATINAPDTVTAGTNTFVLGSGKDPDGFAITEYSWTTSNGKTLTGTGGNIKIDSATVITLKVKNSENIWSDTATKVINIKAPPLNTQTVNVHYQSNGSDISSIKTYHPDPGPYSATALTISGYNFVGTSPQTITVEAGQEYDIYFDYDGNSSNVKCRILQYFVDQDGKEVFTPYDNQDSPGEEDIYNYRKLSGYELEGKNPRHINNVAGQTITITWVYNKIVPQPPYIELYISPNPIHQGEVANVTTWSGDPKGLGLTYTWTVSDGQVITGTEGKLLAGDKPIVVSVYCTNSIGLKSQVSTVTLITTNDPPIILLYATKEVNIGEDINLVSTIYDPDGDSWTTSWVTPPGMKGTILDNGESVVSFNNAVDVGKTYNFTVKATDKFGLSATSTVNTKILSVYPNATIALSGTQKENRLETLETTDFGGNVSSNIAARKFEFVDSNNGALAVDGNPLSSNVVKSLEPLSNSKLNFIIKKKGNYTAIYTVTNNYGISFSIKQPITVFEDMLPIAPPPIVVNGDSNTKGTSKAAYADPKNTDSAGHSLFTRTLTDNSISNDGDIIAHRYWVRVWDANNNGNLHDDNTAEIFDGGGWKPLSNFTSTGKSDIDEILNIDLSKINDGNLSTVVSESAWVGNYYYYLISKENFGQPTIPQLITDADNRVSDLTDILK